MESYSDSDTSSDSECGSDLEPDNEPDEDEDVQPERSMPPDDDEYETFWTPADQLKAQIDHACLLQLHQDIKARAITPAYQKLPRAWPPRPFDVRTLPDSVQDLSTPTQNGFISSAYLDL